LVEGVTAPGVVATETQITFPLVRSTSRTSQFVPPLAVALFSCSRCPYRSLDGSAT
jgi:hypothetical protein